MARSVLLSNRGRTADDCCVLRVCCEEWDRRTVRGVWLVVVHT